MTYRLSQYRGLLRSLLIYYGQPWKRRRLKSFYRQLLLPGSLVFDIGAHVGSRSRLFRGLGCSVVALEPQPLFHHFLQKSLPKDIVLLPQAVAAEAGTMQLNISSRHPTVSTLSADWIEDVSPTEGFSTVAWDHRVDVTVTTLNDLISRYGLPAFVKIDVEGMEAEILKGLDHPVDLIAVEYLPAALDIADASIDRLATIADYEFNRVEGEAAGFIEPRWIDGATMKASLRRTADNGRSGDLYARRRKTNQSPGSDPAMRSSP